MSAAEPDRQQNTFSATGEILSETLLATYCPAEAYVCMYEYLHVCVCVFVKNGQRYKLKTSDSSSRVGELSGQSQKKEKKKKKTGKMEAMVRSN